MLTEIDIMLVSYAAGIVSGGCFCIGTAFTKVEKMADLCEMRWDYSPLQAEALARQSSEYLTGALFLVVSFGLQVFAILIGLTSSTTPNLAQYAFFRFFLVPLLIFVILAYVLQHCFYEQRKPKLIAELDKRVLSIEKKSKTL